MRQLDRPRRKMIKVRLWIQLILDEEVALGLCENDGLGDCAVHFACTGVSRDTFLFIIVLIYYFG